MRSQLAQVFRRDVEPAPEGHLGLMVQAVAMDGCPLVTLYDHVAKTEIANGFAKLEARLERLYGAR